MFCAYNCRHSQILPTGAQLQTVERGVHRVADEHVSGDRVSDSQFGVESLANWTRIARLLRCKLSSKMVGWWRGEGVSECTRTV